MVLIGGCLALLAVIDVVHFGLAGPSWLAWPAFYLAWVVPWLLGGWWRSASIRPGFSERLVGLALAIGGAVAAGLLVWRAGYQASLIDYGSEGRSNTNPPTLYTALVGLAQVGLLMLVARSLDRLGARFRAFWDRAGSVAIGVYAWHLTSLSLCVGIVAIPGVWAPRRLSAAWWMSRPVWLAAVLAGCAALVAATAWVRARLAAHETAPRPASTMQLTFGVLVAAAGGAVVGLYGPANAGRAIVCCALLGSSWLLLRCGDPAHNS